MVAALCCLAGLAATPAEDLAELLVLSTPEAAAHLAQAGDAAAEQIAQALATHSNAAPMMAEALLHSPNAAARGALEQALRSTDQRLGYFAALALGRLGDPAGIGPLVSVLPATDQPKAYWELAYWTPQAWVSMFERRTENGQVVTPPAPEGVPNLRVAYAALVALGQLGGPEATAALTRMLASDQWLIRTGAVQGLASVRYEPARHDFERLARDDPTLVVRKAARDALARLDGAEAALPERPVLGVPAIAFIKAQARTESSLGFQDSYPFPKMPWYHWGENIYVLSPPRPDGELRNLTGFTGCRVQGLEVSYDGARLLFSMCDDNEHAGFHVCEIGVDGSGFRRLTSGNCNDVDPCYLPDGRIAFSSDRSGHHEYYHQERSRNIYAMGSDGSDIQRLTFNPNEDYDPLALSDGRIAYTSYRFYGQDGSGDIYQRGSDLNRIETQLRAINPDGTGDTLLYGAQRGSFYAPVRPMVDGLADSGASFVRGESDHIGVSVSFVRELPDGRLACVTPAGLTVLDLSVDALSCELPFFPEVVNLAGGEEVYIHSHDEMNPIGRYSCPYPADDGRLFIARAPWYRTGFGDYGLYLFDMDTRESTLVYDDPAVSDVDPVVLAARPVPPRIQPNMARGDATTGTVLCLSAFNSDKTYDHSAARYVRVLGAVLMGQTINANASFESSVLGTAPLQPDGSFLVEVPADRPFRFQILDSEERVLLHETEFSYVRGGERVTCIGCHEPKGTTPPPKLPDAVASSPYPCLESPGALIYHGRTPRSYTGVARP